MTPRTSRRIRQSMIHDTCRVSRPRSTLKRDSPHVFVDIKPIRITLYFVCSTKQHKTVYSYQSYIDPWYLHSFPRTTSHLETRRRLNLRRHNAYPYNKWSILHVRRSNILRWSNANTRTIYKSINDTYPASIDPSSTVIRKIHQIFVDIVQIRTLSILQWSTKQQ